MRNNKNKYNKHSKSQQHGFESQSHPKFLHTFNRFYVLRHLWGGHSERHPNSEWLTEWGELLPHKNTNTDRRTKGVDLGGLDLSFTSTLASVRFSVGVLDECFDAEMDETLDGHERI